MPLSLDRQNAYRRRYASLRPGWRPATEQYEALIRQHLRPGMRVVDLGCGRGGVLEQLGPAADRPLGLDPDLRSLVEHRLPDLPRAVASADAIPLPAASVDLALSSWVLEHLPDPARTFREVARVCGPAARSSSSRRAPTAPPRCSTGCCARCKRGWCPGCMAARSPTCSRSSTAPTAAARSRRWPAPPGWSCRAFHQVEDPTYFAFHPLIFRLNAALVRALPRGMYEHIFAAYTKPE